MQSRVALGVRVASRGERIVRARSTACANNDKGDAVIIRPAIARIASMLSGVALLAVLFPGAAGAASGGISGTVTAANGTPAAGVLIQACQGTVCSTTQAGS